MSEAMKNDYRALEVSALAKEGMAHEARREAEALIKQAEGFEAQALWFREEMGRVASMLDREEA